MKKRLLIALSITLSLFSGYLLSMQNDMTVVAENDYVIEMNIERALRFDYIASSKNVKMLVKTEFSLFEGDRVFGAFKVRRIKGNTDYEKYLLESGIYYSAKCISIDSVKSSGGIERIRTLLINRVKEVYPDAKVNGFINSLLWGYRKDLNSDLKKGFLHSGVIHLIAISGQHTTVIFALIMLILFPLPIGRKVKMLIGMAIIIFYGFLTYLNPPVMRAVLFISIIIAGEILSRDTDNENMLLIAMIIMLVFNTKNFLDEGFMLSFIAVYGLFITPRIVKSNNSIVKTAASSLIILLLTLPFMMFRFKYVSIGSPLFTLLLLPFFNTLLPLGLLSVIPGMSFLKVIVHSLFFFIERIIVFSESLPLFFNISTDYILFIFLFGTTLLVLNKQFRTSALISALFFVYTVIKINCL